jgi:hypothetical protein
LVITNSVIITYINNRISNSSIGKQAEINLILTELYSSLLLYSSMYTGDMYFPQYVDYFLRYLPQVLINPENTTSHRILYNLKPYHVELYSIYNTGVRCQDKFNQVFIDDEKGLNFLCSLMNASVLTAADNHIFDIGYENSDVDCEVSDFVDPFTFLSSLSDEHVIFDTSDNLDFEKIHASAMTVSESYIITKT